MLCKRGLAVMWCLSACVSVTLVNSVEMNKHIFKLFHHWLAAPSSFSTPNVMVIFRQGTFPNRVIECRCQRIRGFTTMRYINRLFTYLLTYRWGRHKSQFWPNTWLHRMLSMLWSARCYQHSVAVPWQVMTLIADSKRRTWLMVGDEDEMFMTKSQRYAKDSRIALIVCIDKSVACVTNNKRLWSMFCTVEANYWQIRSIVRPLCDSIATCCITCSSRTLHGFFSVAERVHFLIIYWICEVVLL